MSKPNLLVIACGASSLHQQWIEDHTKFNFDLFLIQYDDSAYSDQNSTKTKFHVRSKGFKFPLTCKYVTREVYRDYKQIALFDDDVKAQPSLIHNLFEVANQANFDMCQPALTHDSCYSHLATLAIPGAFFHLTNTVEIMCPIFSNRALNLVINEFDVYPDSQGYGLDVGWPVILNSENGQTLFGGHVGVIDKFPVTHTKPVVVRPGISETQLNFFRQRYNVKHSYIFKDEVMIFKENEIPQR